MIYDLYYTYVKCNSITYSITDIFISKTNKKTYCFNGNFQNYLIFKWIQTVRNQGEFNIRNLSFPFPSQICKWYHCFFKCTRSILPYTLWILNLFSKSIFRKLYLCQNNLKTQLQELNIKFGTSCDWNSNLIIEIIAWFKNKMPETQRRDSHYESKKKGYMIYRTCNYTVCHMTNKIIIWHTSRSIYTASKHKTFVNLQNDIQTDRHMLNNS